MLDKPVDEIVYENGAVVGVKSGSEVTAGIYNGIYNVVVTCVILCLMQTAKTKAVIGDPTYFKDKVKSVGKVYFIHVYSNVF